MNLNTNMESLHAVEVHHDKSQACQNKIIYYHTISTISNHVGISARSKVTF